MAATIAGNKSRHTESPVNQKIDELAETTKQPQSLDQAACAVKCLPLLEIEAKKRQVAAGRFAGKDSDGKPIVQVDKKIYQPEETRNPQSIDQAAEMLNVSQPKLSKSSVSHGILKSHKTTCAQDGLTYQTTQFIRQSYCLIV